MISLRHLVPVGFALSLAGLVCAGPAMAQYYGGDRGYARPDPGPRYERGYDRRGGYERGDGYERRDGYRRGSYDDRRDGYGQGRRADPMAGMSLEAQKQAVRNHREAQKKAIKRGYVIP
jgi:hypothetical protein